jgi:2,3-dihydroxybenzoate-AMP ligase
VLLKAVTIRQVPELVWPGDLAPRYPVKGVVYRSPDFAREQLDRGYWINSTIGESLRAAARAVPGKIALIDPEQTVRFSELDSQSESVAASLLQLGMLPGDRAIFQIGTISAFFTAFYGCMKAGVIPVCTLPQYRRSEMVHFAKATSAKAIFVQADISPHFDHATFAVQLAAAMPTLQHVIVARGMCEGASSLEAMAVAFDREAAREQTRRIDPRIADVAVFQLSGGSTNQPKIVPRMHGEYLGTVRQLSERYGLTNSDVMLWNLPLVHNAGTMFAVLPVALEGRTLVLQPSLNTPEMLRLIETHGVTFSGSIGPLVAKLLEVTDVKNYRLGSLKQFFSLARAEALETHLEVCVSQAFGMTEGIVFAAAPSASQFLRHHTVGYPISSGDSVRLLAPGTEAEVAFGEIGELCFCGPSTVTGYFDDPAATTRSFTSDGFFRSGDLMRAHHIDGYLCYSFEGRIVDNINRGGEKIGSEEIESLIVRHPGVADARVVAMPDAIYGEKACAFVIPYPEQPVPTVLQLGEFLLDHGIAKYKIPERVEVIASFPLTLVGKVDKARLRVLIAEKMSREAEVNQTLSYGAMH